MGRRSRHRLPPLRPQHRPRPPVLRPETANNVTATRVLLRRTLTAATVFDRLFSDDPHRHALIAGGGPDPIHPYMLVEHDPTADGLSPAWWATTYPTFPEATQAGDDSPLHPICVVDLDTGRTWTPHGWEPVDPANHHQQALDL